MLVLISKAACSLDTRPTKCANIRRGALTLGGLKADLSVENKKRLYSRRKVPSYQLCEIPPQFLVI